MPASVLFAPLFIGLFIGAILATVFWIWMLVEAATKESDQGNEKIVWILVILFTNWVGALIYFLARRPTRMRTLGR